MADHLSPRLRVARESSRREYPNHVEGRVWDQIIAVLGDNCTGDSTVTITCGDRSVEIYAHFILGLDRELAEYEDERSNERRRLREKMPPPPSFSPGFPGDLMRIITSVLTDSMPCLYRQMTTWPCKQTDCDRFTSLVTEQIVSLLSKARDKAVARANDLVSADRIREEAYLDWEKARSSNPDLSDGDGKDFWLAAEARLKLQRLMDLLVKCFSGDIRE